TRVPVRLNVTPVPLTITANDKTRPYATPNPPLDATYSGFINGDTPASLTGTLSCVTTAVQSSPVGGYPITCSGQTSTNYTITYVPGTLKVTPVPLTTTSIDKTRPYATPNTPVEMTD